MKYLYTIFIVFILTLLVSGCPSENPPSVASFSLTELDIQPLKVAPGETVTISARITNTGGSPGSYDVGLNINGILEDSGTVNLVPGESRDFTFFTVKENPGIYGIRIGNLIGSFTVIPPPPTDSLTVHFIDVGQGDSILIDLGDTEILIDGGGRSPGVADYINAYVDGALEVVVATHPHADHIGGLIEVFSSFVIGELWHNGDTSTSQTYNDFKNAFQAEGCQIRALTRGDTLSVSDLVFEVFHPASLTGSTNNQSIVLYLAYGEIEFLFTGDAEQEAEALMISAGLLSDIDVLKVGHHGSSSSSSPQFLSTLKPEVAIYMAGEGNSYGHPHNETIVALTTVGANIYGTDIHGTIVITTDGIDYDIQLEKQASPVTPAG